MSLQSNCCCLLSAVCSLQSQVCSLQSAVKSADLQRVALWCWRVGFSGLGSQKLRSRTHVHSIIRLHVLVRHQSHLTVNPHCHCHTVQTKERHAHCHCHHVITVIILTQIDLKPSYLISRHLIIFDIKLHTTIIIEES